MDIAMETMNRKKELKPVKREFVSCQICYKN